MIWGQHDPSPPHAHLSHDSNHHTNIFINIATMYLLHLPCGRIGGEIAIICIIVVSLHCFLDPVRVCRDLEAQRCWIGDQLNARKILVVPVSAFVVFFLNFKYLFGIYCIKIGFFARHQPSKKKKKKLHHFLGWWKYSYIRLRFYLVPNALLRPSKVPQFSGSWNIFKALISRFLRYSNRNESVS